jgi:hypothetical protein
VQLNSESLATIFSAIDKLKGLSDDPHCHHQMYVEILLIDKLKGLSDDLPGFYFTCHQANENKDSKEEILGFMKTADIGIEDFVVPHWFVDFLSIRFCGLPFGY